MHSPQALPHPHASLLHPYYHPLQPSLISTRKKSRPMKKNLEKNTSTRKTIALKICFTNAGRAFRRFYRDKVEELVWRSIRGRILTNYHPFNAEVLVFPKQKGETNWGKKMSNVAKHLVELILNIPGNLLKRRKRLGANCKEDSLMKRRKREEQTVGWRRRLQI